jgi:hypothetical protein
VTGMDPITCLFYITLLWAPTIQNPILTSQHPILKINRQQEILRQN